MPCEPTQVTRAVQLPLKITIQEEMTFDNYIAGENAAAVAWLHKVAIGQKEYAYVWGDRGCGRSHLLQAVCHQAGVAGYSALYLPLDKRQAWSLDFLDNLESVQVICLDDIHLIANEPAWGVAIMHLYNRLQACTRRLVVAGDAPPTRLAIPLADLTSRLAWGNVFHLKSLPEGEKITFLQTKAQKKGFSLSEEVAQFLINRGPRNVADLMVLFEQLDEASLSAKRRVTIPFVKEVFGW